MWKKFESGTGPKCGKSVHSKNEILKVYKKCIKSYECTVRTSSLTTAGGGAERDRHLTKRRLQTGFDTTPVKANPGKNGRSMYNLVATSPRLIYGVSGWAKHAHEHFRGPTRF